MLQPLVQAIELWFNTFIAHDVLPFLGMVIEYAVIGLLITPLFLINHISDAIDIFAGVRPIYYADRLDAADIETVYNAAPAYLLWKEEYERTPPYPPVRYNLTVQPGSNITNPIKDIWKGHIQNNESIVLRNSKRYDDPQRYMPYIREFLTENNIKPDSEEMYRALANALCTGTPIGSEPVESDIPAVAAANIPAPPQMNPYDAYYAVTMPKTLDVPYFEYTNPKSDEGLYVFLEAYHREGRYSPVLEDRATGKKLSRSEKKEFNNLNKNNAPIYWDIFKNTVNMGYAYPDYLTERLKYLRNNPSPGNNAELTELHNAVYADRESIGEFMNESPYNYVNYNVSTEKDYINHWVKNYPQIDLGILYVEWKKILPFFHYWPANGAHPKYFPPPEMMTFDEWFNASEQAEVKEEYNRYYNERYNAYYYTYYPEYLPGYIARVSSTYPLSQAIYDASSDVSNWSQSWAKIDADAWVTTQYNAYKKAIEDERKKMPSWNDKFNFFMSFGPSMYDDDLLYGDLDGDVEDRMNITVTCFYPANALWIDFIQNNADIVERHDRAYNDTLRYTDQIRTLMAGLNIKPDTDEFYQAIADKVLSYDMSIGDVPVNKWLPAELGYTPHTAQIEQADTEAFINVETRGTLLDYFITNPVVTTIFWGITIISMALCIGFSIYAVVQAMGDMELKRPVSKVLGLVGKSMLTFLIIPFFALTCLNLSALILRQTTTAIFSRSGSERVTISGALFTASMVPEAVLVRGETPVMESYTVNKDRKIVLRDNFRFADEQTRLNRYYELIEKYNGERIGYTHLPEMRKDFDILLLVYPGYLLLISLCAWIFVVLLIVTMFMFIRKIFDIVMLYIVSPFYTSTIPLDDGLVFKRWREKFIGACITGFGTLITFQLFLVIIPLIWERGFELTDNIATDSFLKVLLMLGGVYTVYKSHTLISGLFSPDAAQSESGVMGAAVAAAATAGAAVKMVGEMVVKEVTGTDGSEVSGGSGGDMGGNKEGGLDKKDDDKDKDKEKDGDKEGSGNKNPNMGQGKDSSVGAGNKDDSIGKGDKDAGMKPKDGSDEDSKHKPPEREPPKPPGQDKEQEQDRNKAPEQDKEQDRNKDQEQGKEQERDKDTGSQDVESPDDTNASPTHDTPDFEIPESLDFDGLDEDEESEGQQ